ncbi:MAG: carboxypeptidase-like regulatory domain-containing protein [Terriglobales bacterium]
MKKLGFILLLTLVNVPGFAGRHDDTGPVCNLNFVVVRDYNGKPVRNAAVVLHQVSDKGKQESGGIELKSDPEGKANYDGVPYGKLRVQVLMRGFQTYGGDYEINQPTMKITVRLKRPEEQYSIYGPNGEAKQPEEKK